MSRLNNEGAYPNNLIAEIFCDEKFDRIINEDVVKGLNFVLEDLSEQEQDYIRLYYAEGYTYKEIAEVYSVSKGIPISIAVPMNAIKFAMLKLKNPKRKNYIRYGYDFVRLSEQYERERVERVLKAQKNNPRDILIADLEEVSVMTYCSLNCKGLVTIGKMIDFIESNGHEWYKIIPNFGIRSFAEIENVLNWCNIK